MLNATGVIVHTNLGRAPLAEAALERVREAAGYSNLEYDLATGSRGSRQDHLAPLLRRLTGAEAAIVVNNNAAALLLALAALAEGREVVVSRGELIEIGDGFRIPDVLARSGARLVEVGTTNRTRAADYERAIGPDTALLLRVHQSNFRVVGFTEQPRRRGARGGRAPARAAARRRPRLRRARRASRASRPRPPRSPPAPTSSASRATSCSAGRRRGSSPAAPTSSSGCAAIRSTGPLRSDKLTLAALEGTLALYLDRPDEVPVLRMLREPAEAVRARAERLAAAVGGTVEETVARAGGGSLPLAELPSFACAVEEELAAALRARRAAGDRGRPRRPHAARLPHAHRRRGRRGRGGGSRVPLTVGTAGHIDHGKTWLVRALTGKDTDRLPEERARGISIDLGYAPLDLPDGRRLSLIDVPGPRALRPQHGRRRDRDRPLPARDRRGRGRAAADARAPRDPVAARDRARRRRGHEGGRGRRRDARARASRRRASSSRAPRPSP